MQVGASFLSAALKKQTKSGFHTELHVGSAATEPLSEMSSSSCMHGSVCSQLPCWGASATNPARRGLCPSSCSSWGHHRATAQRITSCFCSALQQVRSPPIYRNAFSCDHLWAQSAKCNLATAPEQTRERKHPLAAPVSCPHALSSRDSLLLSNTLLQTGKC